MPALLPRPVIGDAVLASERSRCRAWVGGVIAALFIALASALLPGAMPSSQTVGSAFNPATTLVALSRTEAEHDGFVAAPADGAKQVPHHAPPGKAVAAAVAQKIVYGDLPRARDATVTFSDAPVVLATLRPGSGPRAPPAARPFAA